MQAGRLLHNVEIAMLFTQCSFNAADIHSLCWRANQLVDWVGGGRTFGIDGTEWPAQVAYGYRFDAATASPDGRFAVIYERLGTKALLLHDGQILRELGRSYYLADAYEYPVALFNHPDGRVLLAHCPTEYCRIEIEEAHTGRSLTALTDRKPSDFFHSRLIASPRGKRLISAGWVWHPLSLVKSFDIEKALADAHHLDDCGGFPSSFNLDLAEENSACWLDDDHIAVAASAELDQDNGEDYAGPILRADKLAICDVIERTCIRTFRLEEPAGTILAVGSRFIISLYRHPKLIDLSTGEIVHEWTELRSGLQDGSIIHHLDSDAIPPPMAFDPETKQFAIANGDKVHLIGFSHSAVRAEA